MEHSKIFSQTCEDAPNSHIYGAFCSTSFPEGYCPWVRRLHFDKQKTNGDRILLMAFQGSHRILVPHMPQLKIIVHRETMLGILSYQVSEPLRALMNGAPLEDALHLTHQYDRMCQEIEIQAAEVISRQSKFRESSAENVLKLKNSENKLSELKSSMLALGREAAAAMLSVEDQQQESTFRKILSMVDSERSYHQNAVAILEKLHYEMILEEQTDDSSLQSENPSIKDDISLVNEEKVSI